MKQNYSPEKHQTIIGYANLHGISVKSLGSAISLGKRASLLCRNFGYPRFRVQDDRYGAVWAYPPEVLSQVFDEVG